MDRRAPIFFRPWFQPIALLLITALAAVLRFGGLERIPPGFHYDEAYEALEAWRLITQPGYHPIFFPGNFGVEPMFIYLTGLAFRLFGQSPAIMRSVAAIAGTLTVPAIYALSRELARIDDRIPLATPLLAAAVLATMRWHIHFSRVGIEPILVPLFLVLIMWLLFRARRTNGIGSWLALGIAVGLSLYTYPAGRLLPVVAALLVLWTLLTHTPDYASRGRRYLVLRRGKEEGVWVTGLVLALVAAVLVFVPLGLNWLQHPDQLFLRSSQIAVGVQGAGPGSPGQNLVATLGMFSFRGDIDSRNNVPGLPVLDVLMSVPFYLGVCLALWRWRRPAWGGLLLAGAIMLAPTVFSEYAPHFRRALGAAPVVALLCATGLAMLLGRRATQPATRPQAIPWRLQESGVAAEELATGMDALRRIGRLIVVVALLIGSAVYATTAYFGTWGRSHAIYYAYDQGLWEIGQYVLGLPASERVYLTPRPSGDMTLAFAWRQGRSVRHFDGRSAFVAPAYAPGPATYIVIEHEDFRGGQLLRALYPQAQEVKIFLDRDGRVYARAFRVPDPALFVRRPKVTVSGSWPGMNLVGFDLDKSTYRPGEIVYLQLWWRATAATISTDWTVFTHLLGQPKADGSVVWAGRDARPGQGSTPTTTWVSGDLILDEYQLQLPLNAPSGSYQIEVGLYNPAAGGARALTSNPGGQDHLIVGVVVVQ